MKETFIESFDKTPVYCRLWDDVESPKAVLQISHGMCEHSGRYERFARYMNSRGYIVFADDHRAHGRTESDENRGYHEGDIFGKTLKDLLFFHEYLKKEYSLPTVFLGHSYGSFLGQGFAQQGTDVKGIALCGSAKMGCVVPAIGGILLAPFRLLIKKAKFGFINRVSDLLFDGKYKGDSGRSQWVTGDKQRRKDFLDDSYCGISMSVNFYYCMVTGISKLYGRKALSRLNSSTRIDVFSGDMDPIGGNKAKKAIALNKMYRKQNIPSNMHVFENSRHEIINDIDYERAQNELANFFDECIAK